MFQSKIYFMYSWSWMSGHTSAEQDSAFAEMSTEDGANSGRGNV